MGDKKAVVGEDEKSSQERNFVPTPVVADNGPLRRSIAHFGQAYFRWLTPVAVLVGAVLRTREWLHDKSLWLDEYSITQNIVNRSFTGLLKPLDYTQAGPIGWLWCERAAIKIFGVHELSLRLLPWLASLAALIVFPALAKSLLGRSAVPAATVLFATSPALTYYAAETKQYSSDVTCVLLVLMVTTRLASRPPTARRCLVWGASCGVLIWFSQPAILVAATCGLCLVFRWHRDRAALLSLVAGGVVLSASLIADWLIALRALSKNALLRAYWASGYPPTTHTVHAYREWLYRTVNALIEQVAHYTQPEITLVLAAWGLATLARRRSFSALILGLIPVLALVMAVTRQYPLASRLALYLLPIWILLLVAGVAESDVVSQQSGWRRWLAGGVALTAVLFCTADSIGTGLSKILHPDDTTSGRQAIAFVARHQQPGDVVLEDSWASSAFQFYGSKYHVTTQGSVAFTAPPAAGCPVNPLAVLGNTARVWLVFAHRPLRVPADRAQIYGSQLTTRSTEIASFTGAGSAGAYLFDFTKPPRDLRTPLAPWIKGGCFTVKLAKPLP